MFTLDGFKTDGRQFVAQLSSGSKKWNDEQP